MRWRPGGITACNMIREYCRSGRGRPSIVACHPGTLVRWRRRTCSPLDWVVSRHDAGFGCDTGTGVPMAVSGGSWSACGHRYEVGRRGPWDAVELFTADLLVEHPAVGTAITVRFEDEAHPVDAGDHRRGHAGTVVGQRRLARLLPRTLLPRHVVGAGDDRVVDGQLMDSVDDVVVHRDSQAWGKQALRGPEPDEGGAHCLLEGNGGRGGGEGRGGGGPQAHATEDEEDRLGSDQHQPGPQSQAIATRRIVGSVGAGLRMAEPPLEMTGNHIDGHDGQTGDDSDQQPFEAPVPDGVLHTREVVPVGEPEGDQGNSGRAEGRADEPQHRLVARGPHEDMQSDSGEHGDGEGEEIQRPGEANGVEPGKCVDDDDGRGYEDEHGGDKQDAAQRHDLRLAVAEDQTGQGQHDGDDTDVLVLVDGRRADEPREGRAEQILDRKGALGVEGASARVPDGSGHDLQTG